jgi:hypothetical protein
MTCSGKIALTEVPVASIVLFRFALQGQAWGGYERAA